MIRLESQYFGSIAYWCDIARNKQVVIDAEEHFEKQSYRNRVVILGPNGPLPMIVPIYGRNSKQKMKEVRISYEESWLRVHLNGLQTAYSSAPYFEYLYPEFETLLSKKPVYLLDLNQSLVHYLKDRLKLDTQFSFSESYDLLPTEQEGRHKHHPKKEKGQLPIYPQVFQERFGFVSGIGIIDLLMNDLSGASDYLRKLALR